VTKHSGNTSGVPTPPLALDTELRLLPQQLSLGKAELLTDALILPFTDIENRLGHYALSSSDTEMKQLTRRMKNYLGRLNANPHIPLKFRLDVLNRFEQALDLFDAEMTAAILNAHKIGVMLVQEAARNHRDYYPTLVDMIANAIELAVKLLLIDMEQYRAPSIIVTRQFFDLARLGLDVSAAMGDTAPSKTSRLYKAVCNHEIVRKIDFFSHPRARQQQIWQELQCHIGVLRPHLYCAGDTPAGADIHHDSASWLLINLNRPNDPSRIIRQLSGPVEYDCIVINLDKLTARLNKAIHSVKAVLLDPHMQKTALHTEQALESALIGGQAMLAALRDDNRTTERSGHAEARVQIHFDLRKAIIKAFTATTSAQASHLPATWDQASAWSLINFNQTGICLERIHTESRSELPGHLVGLDWQLGKNSLQRVFIAWNEGMDKKNQPVPALGFIRWAKTMKAGEQRIGIEFFNPGFKLARAIITGGDQGMDDKRTWPVLIQAGTSSHQMIFPATSACKHMTFKLLLGKQQAYFKIRSVREVGQNYSLCDILRATPK